MPDITIPSELLPNDGRFGCGPSRVRPEQVNFLSSLNPAILGTSHRQAPVKDLVRSVQEGLAELFRIPDGYEVLLGNGGATAFWDSAVHSLIERQSQHLTFGEFGAKFATAAHAPFLEAPEVLSAEPGERSAATPHDSIDLYAWPHNETSTGVMAPVRRVHGADGALTVIDATSGAGGIDFDAAEADVYYFSPQKNFGSDGGLWFALFSPAALERVERIEGSDRYIPDFLKLSNAVTNSRLHQTLNTPALGTIALLDEQVRWMNSQGGLAWAAARTHESSNMLYRWAEASSVATPFVSNPDDRSQVVVTIDFDDAIDASAISKTLRANGIVDTEPYRKLGRNQLRIGTFVSVEPSDVEKLISALDYVLEQL
jgi:phosphoserine aminotransferase